MENLSKILNNTIGDVNASGFAKQYYHRPAEVLYKNRNKIYRPNFNGASLSDRKKHFARARSQFDGLIIIPYEGKAGSSIVSYGDSNHLMKKHLLLPLFRERSKQNAISNKATPGRKFHAALRLSSLEDSFVGYDWTNLKGDKVVTVSYTDAIRGTSLAKSSDVALDSNDYNAQRYSGEIGGKVNARVKSESDNSTYSFRIDRVPIRFKDKKTPPEAYALWFDITSNHSCEKVNYSGLSFSRPVKILKTGRTFERKMATEYKLCQHIIAGIKKYNRIRISTEIALDPILEFKNKGLEFYNKLHDKTLMEVNVAGRIKLTPLNEVNENMLLHDLIKINPYLVYFRA